MSEGIRPAFTVVELLVVITTIVVLLALLAPALDKAIYQAELTVCATRLKAISSGAAMYTMDFNRWYPDRPMVNAGSTLTTDLMVDTLAVALGVNSGVDEDDRQSGIKPVDATVPSVLDDRPVIRNHIHPNLLVDPLVVKVDLAGSTAIHVQNSFTSLWVDVSFPNHKPMHRLGDRWTWTDTFSSSQPKTYSFDLVATDSDYFTDQNGGTVYASHPDEEGKLYNIHQDRSTLTYSYWGRGGGTRGPADFNYAYADGSVTRLNKVKTNVGAGHEDDRVASVPMRYNAGNYPAWRQQVPAR